MSSIVSPQPARTSAIKTVALDRATFVTADLAAARRLFEEVFGFECVRHRPRAMLVRESGHASGEGREALPYWVLEVEEVPRVENPQAVLNHWGVFVPSQSAVDLAFSALVERKDRYRLGKIQKPRVAHGAYSFYFQDMDSNWWEIEHRIARNQYEALRERGDIA